VIDNQGKLISKGKVIPIASRTYFNFYQFSTKLTSRWLSATCVDWL